MAAMKFCGLLWKREVYELCEASRVSVHPQLLYRPEIYVTMRLMHENVNIKKQWLKMCLGRQDQCKNLTMLHAGESPAFRTSGHYKVNLLFCQHLKYSFCRKTEKNVSLCSVTLLDLHSAAQCSTG